MTIDKILKEAKSRIDYLEKKKKGLIILEITRQEREKREEIINNEIYRLYAIIRV